MRWILTLGCGLLVAAVAAKPATATVHAAMYCWVPDFEIAIACDDDDEGSDGDDSARGLLAKEYAQPSGPFRGE